MSWSKVGWVKPADFSWRYQVLFPVLAQLPPALSYRLAAYLGQQVFKARHMGGLGAIEAQMRHVYPHVSDAQIASWLADYCRMVEQEALDTWYVNQSAIKQIVRLTGFEAIQEARTNGQRVILTGGHFGRFWLAGPAMRALGYSIGTLTRDGRANNEHGLHPAEHRYRLRKLQQLQRALSGPFLIEGNDIRPLYQAIEKHLMTLIFDVPYAKKHHGGVTVPFLSGTIKVPTGIYKIAKKTQAVIAPFYMRDLGNGGVVAEFGALLNPYNYNDEECMSLLASQLEARIGSSPGQWWLWAALPLLRRE